MDMRSDLYVPNMFHKSIAMEKGLCNDNGEFIEKYYILQKAYQYYLEQYLDMVLGIRKFDQLFATSPLVFTPVKDEAKDIYQLNSSFQYYYVRNTLYVEKLTKTDIDFILSEFTRGNKDLSKEMQLFIQRTFGMVISSDFFYLNTLTNYGPTTSRFMAPADGLVLGFRYDLFADGDKEGWLDRNFDRTQFLNKVLEQQENEYQDKLLMPISIIMYDDQCVKQARGL